MTLAFGQTLPLASGFTHEDTGRSLHRDAADLRGA